MPLVVNTALKVQPNLQPTCCLSTSKYSSGRPSGRGDSERHGAFLLCGYTYHTYHMGHTPTSDGQHTPTSHVQHTHPTWVTHPYHINDITRRAYCVICVFALTRLIRSATWPYLVVPGWSAPAYSQAAWCPALPTWQSALSLTGPSPPGFPPPEQLCTPTPGPLSPAGLRSLHTTVKGAMSEHCPCG